MVMEKAGWAPFVNVPGHRYLQQRHDLSCYVFHVNYQFDFATICKK
jgi:hypothetical protein